MDLGGYVRGHRVQKVLRLRGELVEIGIGTEAARQHLMDSVLAQVGGIVGALAYDVRGGDERGIQAATLAGFDGTNSAVFAAHRIHGRKFNPVCRVQMERLAGPERTAGEMITASNMQLVTPAEWESCAFVNEYVRPSHVAHYLGSVMWFAPGVTEGIGMMRAAGDRPFTDEDCLVLHLMRDGVGSMFRDQVTLSPRGKQVLALMLQGAADKDIAASLRISPHTVRDYVRAVRRAYGVRTRTELVARFLRGKASAPQ